MVLPRAAIAPPPRPAPRRRSPGPGCLPAGQPGAV